MHKVKMKLKLSTIAVFVLFACFFGKADGNENNCTKISELFFPETRNWQSIESAPALDKARFSKIKKQLRQSYYAANLTGKMESNECSFINRVLEDKDIKDFKSIDANSDGVKDIIYTGSAQCAEGDVFLIWYGVGNSFEIRQANLWEAKALKIKQGKKLELTSVAAGCCASPIDEYYLGDIVNIRVKKIIRTTKTTVQPKRIGTRHHFKNANETVLRSSPKIENSYDESLSGLQNVAVFGNILSKFLPGTTGDILAEQKDKNGKLWAYVLLEEQSDLLRYHSPFNVNVGWIESGW